MAEHESFSLPHVDAVDIGLTSFEDMLDPDYKGRWQHLRDTNPELAYEILRRANRAADRAAIDYHTYTQEAVNLSTFVIDALTNALERQREEGENYSNPT